MNCAVKLCPNREEKDWGKLYLQGISLHSLPDDYVGGLTWSKVFTTEEWDYEAENNICSDHLLKFLNIKVCRICLETEGDIISMKEHEELIKLFENVTNVPVSDRSPLPQYLCRECIHQLRKFAKFKDKWEKAESQLFCLRDCEHFITFEGVLDIDRQKYNLKSNLVKKHSPPNHYDITIVYNENSEKIKQYIDENETDIIADVKLEVLDAPVELTHEINVNNKEIDIKSDATKSTEDLDDINNYSDDDMNTETDIEVKPEKIVKEIVRKLKKGTKRLVRDRKCKIKKEVKNLEFELEIDEMPLGNRVRKKRKSLNENDLVSASFGIKNLSPEEQILELHKRKNSANYKNSAYKCTECYKGFWNEETYKTHMLKHSNRNGDLICDICKIRFKKRSSLSHHLTSLHAQRYSCNRCSFIGTDRYSAKKHLKWHEGTVHTCSHCSKNFSRYTTYMSHLRIKHPSDIICLLCGHSFVSDKGLYMHNKLKHKFQTLEVPLDGPSCAPCELRFMSDAALDTHLRVSAKHNPSVTIARSDKRIDKSKKKDKRLGAEGTEGPLPCEQCGLELEDSRAYHNHFRRVHPDKNRTNYPSMKRPCMCEQCGRIFMNNFLLKDHMLTHSNEKSFMCEVCGKYFKSRQILLMHKSKIHRSKEKRQSECKICGKVFFDQSNKRRHMLTVHTGVRQHECEICGKLFQQRGNKVAHVNYVHLKKPWPKRNRDKKASTEESQ